MNHTMTFKKNFSFLIIIIIIIMLGVSIPCVHASSCQLGTTLEFSKCLLLSWVVYKEILR
jgi:hypothetical protein